MIAHRPRKRQWQAWLYVVIWSLMIFITIPLARAIQKSVTQQWSRGVFTYAVVLAIVSASAFAIFYIRRLRHPPRSSYLWLTAVGAVFIGYAIELGEKAPEEAIHFLQYGVLGVLVYRALAYRLHDISIYFATAIVCGMIGVLDEFVQWLTPQRYWGLRDVWLNFFSSALVQVAIAGGLKPTFIRSRPARTNLRFLCRLGIGAAVLFGTTLLATPPRIAWVSERIEGLAFLGNNESVMLEYGYLHADPEIGVFRSRFTLQQLQQIDRRRAVRAAAVLDRFQDDHSYRTFLDLYTPISDPFVHEARVHLFRRDRYFSAAADVKQDADEYQRRLHIASCENRIMEKYFSNTLRHSSYVWPEEKRALARRQRPKDTNCESSVSQNLVTRVGERQVAGFFIVIILSLLFVHRYLGKKPNRIKKK